jgi:hypothetical protein
MTRAVLVMLWVIALHIFPDLVFLYRPAGKDGTEVFEYWCRQILKLMGDEPSAWGCFPIQPARFQDREGLLKSAGIPAGHKYNILCLTPPLPSVTN